MDTLRKAIVLSGGQSLLTRVEGLYTGGRKGGVLDYTDPTIMYEEITGASATTPASVDGPVGAVAHTVNGYYSVAPTNAKRPILRYDGSRYYLEFTAASGHCLQIASFAISNRFYAAFAIDDTASNEFFLEQSANSTLSDGFFITNTAAACWLVRRSALHYRAHSVSWLGADAAIGELFYRDAETPFVKKDGADFTLNGSEIGSMAAQSDVTDTLNIGSRNTASLFHEGKLFGITLYDGNIADEDATLCREWLSEVSGVTIPF